MPPATIRRRTSGAERAGERVMSTGRTGAIALAVVSTWGGGGLHAEPRHAPTVVELQLAPSSVSARGILQIAATISASPDLPDGATVSYSANANAFDGSFSNYHSVTGSATVAGRKVAIAITIPYLWKLVAAGENMTVSLFVSSNVSPPAGAAGPRHYLTASFSKTFATPGAGVTTPIAFSGAL
jgi:hypothetical protein